MLGGSGPGGRGGEPRVFPDEQEEQTEDGRAECALNNLISPGGKPSSREAGCFSVRANRAANVLVTWAWLLQEAFSISFHLPFCKITKDFSHLFLPAPPHPHLHHQSLLLAHN